MEYPGSKFTRPIRLGVLLFFIAAFFLISPTLVLYSAGYRYDFKNGLLRETGSLSVDVIPDNATIYLDGLKLKDSMPIRLNNLSPHKYFLKISAPDYYDWEKQIEIKKNQTTYIKDIILIKKERPEIISKGNIDRLSISKNGKYLAYFIFEEKRNKVIIRDLERDLVINSITVDYKDPKISWSPSSDFLAISPSFPPFKELIIINPASPEGNKNLVSENEINKYIWRKSNESEIYYSSKEKIYSYIPRFNQLNTIASLEKISDWYLDDGELWTASLNTSTGKLELKRDFLGFNSLFYPLSPGSTETTSTLLSWNFQKADSGTVLLWNKELNTYKIVRSDKDFSLSGTKYLVSDYNRWWIFWGASELWTYAENDEPFLLNRSGDQLYDLKPLDQYNTLALQWKDQVTAIYPYYFIEQILIDKPVKSMDIDSAKRTIYYSNSTGLWKLRY